MIPFLLDFFENNNLKYKDILFKLFCYKLKDSKRENYFEKLCAKDIFWNKYQTVYDSDIAKDTYVTGVTNLENESWRRKSIGMDDEMQMLIDKIQDQFEGMPKTGCNYRLAFNEMTWSISEKKAKEIHDQWTSHLYPLSSNVTVWEDYLRKRYITLNFEMNIEKHDMYVNALLKEIDCPCKKEVTFVLDDSEKEKYSNANILIRNLLNEINRDIELEKAETLVNDNLHITYKKDFTKGFPRNRISMGKCFERIIYSLSNRLSQ